MTLKAYSTFAGARRASPQGPILRILDDPRDLFVVGFSLGTRLMAVDPKHGACDGSIAFDELAARP